MEEIEPQIPALRTLISRIMNLHPTVRSQAIRIAFVPASNTVSVD